MATGSFQPHLDYATGTNRLRRLADSKVGPAEDVSLSMGCEGYQKANHSGDKAAVVHGQHPLGQTLMKNPSALPDSLRRG
jgi:hypothetical protein